MSEFNFDAPPTVRGDAPPGYRVTERSRVIGAGPGQFAMVRAAIWRWGVQRGSDFRFISVPERVTVGAVSRFRIPFGMLRPQVTCRVFEIVDEPRLAGFAHGAIRGHPQSGWESYLVEYTDEGSVILHIRVVSRPAAWWMRAAGPAGRLALEIILRRNLRALDGMLRQAPAT